jgi:hypothetical protein
MQNDKQIAIDIRYILRLISSDYKVTLVCHDNVAFLEG